MLRIGLTGGIGSGKSVVADLFAALGVPVIDADVVSRELVAPGEPALAEITARFGADVLGPDGTLDRSRLRERIFSEPEGRTWLEDLLHPRIRERMQARAAAADSPYVLLVIPLLVESGQRNTVDRVLLVDAPEAERIRRVVGRDRVPEAQVQAILDAQASDAERRAVADDVLDNSGALETLENRVQALHVQYLSLATDR